MTFWRCYYHVIWATKNRQPIMTPKIEAIVMNVIRNKSRELECPILAQNAVPDHLHIALNIPPSLAVAAWVKRVKGASSHEVNSMFPDLPERFQWQGGYSVLTFGVKNLEFVVRYIENQKEHHASGTLEPYLEHLDNDGLE